MVVHGAYDRDVTRRLLFVVRALTCFCTQSRARDGLARSHQYPRGDPGEGETPDGVPPTSSRNAATAKPTADAQALEMIAVMVAVSDDPATPLGPHLDDAIGQLEGGLVL
jgi:hypothetical protein